MTDDFPDPSKLPPGSAPLTAVEKATVAAGRDAVAAYLEKVHRREGNVSAIRAALRLQHHAYVFMLRESGVNPKQAMQHYFAISECMGLALGVAEFMYERERTGKGAKA